MLADIQTLLSEANAERNKLQRDLAKLKGDEPDLIDSKLDLGKLKRVKELLLAVIGTKEPSGKLPQR